MGNRFPNLLCSGWPHAHGTGKAPGLLLRLEDYGFNRQQLLRMCFRLPSLLSYSWQRTHGTGDAPGLLLRLEEYGFSAEQIIHMCARFPALLSYAWVRTHGTTDEPGILLRLEEYGFTRDQLIAVCRTCPTIPGYSWKRTHNTLLRLEAAGFDRAEIISLCMRCPILLRCRWKRTAAQLGLARQYTLPLTSQLFLFAPKKTRWRWHFLTVVRGLSPAQARGLLFRPHKEFVQRYRKDYAPSAVARLGSREPSLRPVKAKPSVALLDGGGQARR